MSMNHLKEEAVDKWLWVISTIINSKSTYMFQNFIKTHQLITALRKHSHYPECSDFLISAIVLTYSLHHKLVDRELVTYVAISILNQKFMYEPKTRQHLHLLPYPYNNYVTKLLIKSLYNSISNR